MTTKNKESAHWQVTIGDVHDLTLSDWLVIANAVRASDRWACAKWIDHNNGLAALSLDDWKEVAEEIGLGECWAHFRYKQHSSTEPKAITHQLTKWM